MAKTIKSGWLKDYENNEFIPITHSTKVFNSDGISVEDRLISAENNLDTKFSMIEYGTPIAANTDLNTISIGQYYAATRDISKTLLNCPTTYKFKLICLQGSAMSTLCQFIFVEDSRQPFIYYRIQINNNWYAWSILNDNDNVLQIGFTNLDSLNDEPDLDVLITPGTYILSEDDIEIIGSPIQGQTFRLIVMGGSDGGMCHQILIPDETDSIYIRSTVNIGLKWSAWIDLNTTLETLGITATTTELNYVKGVTSDIQTQLNNKSVVKIVRWSE